MELSRWSTKIETLLNPLYNVAKFKDVNLKEDQERRLKAVILNNHTKIKPMEVTTNLPAADVNLKPPRSIKPKDKRALLTTLCKEQREKEHFQD